MQYAAAAAVLFAVAAATEDMTIRWTGEFVAAFVWLVLVLSIGAVLLLLLLLRRGTASGVSSLYYLVPPAVAVEAYLLFGERVSAALARRHRRHRARGRARRRPAAGQSFWDRMSPSWATVATCVPSAAQICPKHSARPAEAAGLSVS